MNKILRALVWLTPLVGCGDDAPHEETHSPVGEQTSSLTFYEDIVPIFEKHCVPCHREGGGAPFRLDDYASAKARAGAIRHATGSRHMPPWSVTSDGSCGTFADSIALSDAQIAKIGQWAEGGAREGTRVPVKLPEVDALGDALTLTTPVFTPIAAGGELTAADEYRCFELEAPGRAGDTFITGYEIVPGTPAIVHHVLTALVDPSAPSELPDRPGLTNGQLLAELDAASPDRAGWPCYNGAGDGVSVEAAPVTWAPGQGVVRYPGASGIPLRTSHKIIVQVHYNLADASQRGKSDQTSVRLQTSDSVEQVGLFMQEDPLIGSLFEDEPDTLPPGRKSYPYTWSTTLGEDGMPDLPGLVLYGVMPHMHELGRKYHMRIIDGGASQCAAEVRHWDFHWQRFYFYDEPYPMTPQTRIEVTCDFDTSGRTEPVLPGWGTQNEMCLATLYFTVPRVSYEAALRARMP